VEYPQNDSAIQPNLLHHQPVMESSLLNGCPQIGKLIIFNDPISYLLNRNKPRWYRLINEWGITSPTIGIGMVQHILLIESPHALKAWQIPSSASFTFIPCHSVTIGVKHPLLSMGQGIWQMRSLARMHYF
jgi:hypothetical protein